jgi:murein DD-endopeptidase MepM/ murein hydrolase activator NlpD
LALADEQTFFWRVTAPVAGFIRRHFPERHIIFKDHRRVVCLKVRTAHQLIAAGGVLGCMVWAFLATAAFLHGATQLASRDQEIAARAAEIDDMKNNYQAAFGKLDEFQSIFSGITCEITDIQDSLLRITEKSVTTSRRNAAGMPHLDPDANKCRSDGRVQWAALPALEGRVDSSHIVGPLPDGAESQRQIARLEPAGGDSDTLQRRVNQLTGELDRLRESHGAFLRHSADLTALRIGELEKTLASVGVNAKAAVALVGDGHFGRGGPFIAAPLRDSALSRAAIPDDFNPISLFNSHADRLDSLANVLKSLPLASPLAEYEMTSPFGSRNDPINAMTGIHEGVDLGAASGTPVTATGDGQVVWAGWRDRYGNMVEIDHGNGLKTRYAHLSKISVLLGVHVGRGAVVGLVGETGRTTGPHLHYEVRMAEQATNPMKFIAAGQNVLKTQ